MHGYRYHIRPGAPPTAVRITPMPNVISPRRCEGISKSLRGACTDDSVKSRIGRDLPLVVNPCEVGSKGQAAAYADARGRSCNRRGGIGDEDIPEVGVDIAVVGDGFTAGGAILDIFGGGSRGSWVCTCPKVPVVRGRIACGEVYSGAGAGDVGHGDDRLSREVEIGWIIGANPNSLIDTANRNGGKRSTSSDNKKSAS